MRFAEPDFELLSAGEKRKITGLRKSLLAWYAHHGRQFPWRSPEASEFEKICVEVLLQRTRADTVAGIYRVFFDRFRDWTDLATVPSEELEQHLKPIGLWRRRAVSIKGLAFFAAERGGSFPGDLPTLAKVPGVGQYVMNAILLFQHGARRPLVDMNMARVLERFVHPRDLADIRYDPWLQAAAHWLVKDRPIETNWATLDFAAKVCAARKPVCRSCPIGGRCDWLRRQVSQQT